MDSWTQQDTDAVRVRFAHADDGAAGAHGDAGAVRHRAAMVRNRSSWSRVVMISE